MSDPKPGAPKLSYWHIWTDDEGVSHQEKCEFTAFDLQKLGPGNTPQWINTLGEDVTAILTVLPPKWKAGWHMNRVAQWIFTLSGRWYVESMDGTRVEMGPGDFMLGADQHCKADNEGRIGHLSGNDWDEPCVQLLAFRNDDAWTAARPGFFN